MSFFERFYEWVYERPRANIFVGVLIITFSLVLLAIPIFRLKRVLFPPCEDLIAQYKEAKREEQVIPNVALSSQMKKQKCDYER